MRYGVGLNVLETTFGFLGANEDWATGLAVGTGISLKAVDFFNNGLFTFDYQIRLGDDVNLDLFFDLQSDPDNLQDVRRVDTGLGISGHF